MAKKGPPPGWGDDHLTKFLDDGRWNQWASFANKREAVGRLIAIDALFMRVSENWLNPESELAAILLMRSLGAFRAAAGLAMAGQAADCYPACRAVLENAAYGVHIYLDPSLAMVWVKRHDDGASMRAQKQAFAHRAVVTAITRANQDTAARFGALYDKTIDLGGHPNQRAVTSNMKMTKEQGKLAMTTILQHADGPSLDHAFKTVAQCGLCALELLQIPFSARFELLGVRSEMFELCKGL